MFRGFTSLAAAHGRTTGALWGLAELVWKQREDLLHPTPHPEPALMTRCWIKVAHRTPLQLSKRDLKSNQSTPEDHLQEELILFPELASSFQVLKPNLQNGHEASCNRQDGARNSSIRTLNLVSVSLSLVVSTVSYFKSPW